MGEQVLYLVCVSTHKGKTLNRKFVKGVFMGYIMERLFFQSGWELREMLTYFSLKIKRALANLLKLGFVFSLIIH